MAVGYWKSSPTDEYTHVLYNQNCVPQGRNTDGIRWWPDRRKTLLSVRHPDIVYTRIAYTFSRQRQRDTIKKMRPRRWKNNWKAEKEERERKAPSTTSKSEEELFFGTTFASFQQLYGLFRNWKKSGRGGNEKGSAYARLPACRRYRSCGVTLKAHKTRQKNHPVSMWYDDFRKWKYSPHPGNVYIYIAVLNVPVDSHAPCCQNSMNCANVRNSDWTASLSSVRGKFASSALYWDQNLLGIRFPNIFSLFLCNTGTVYLMNLARAQKFKSHET